MCVVILTFSVLPNDVPAMQCMKAGVQQWIRLSGVRSDICLQQMTPVSGTSEWAV